MLSIHKKTDKLLFHLLIFCMVFSLTACSAREAAKPSGGQAGSTEDPAMEEPLDSEQTQEQSPNGKEEIRTDSPEDTDWKIVDVQMTVQGEQTGIIDGEFLDIRVKVPNDWEYDTEQKVFTKDGAVQSAGYFATQVEEQKPSLSSINPEDAVGYLSHRTIQLDDETEVLLIVTDISYGLYGKENIPEESERLYGYQYSMIHDDCIISISFQALGKNNEEAIELQKKILESISYI